MENLATGRTIIASGGVVGMYGQQGTTTTQRCLSLGDTFQASVIGSEMTYGYCGLPATSTYFDQDFDLVYTKCDSPRTVIDFLTHMNVCGGGYACDTVTLYENTYAIFSTLWISCFPNSIVSDPNARTLFLSYGWTASTTPTVSTVSSSRTQPVIPATIKVQTPASLTAPPAKTTTQAPNPTSSTTPPPTSSSPLTPPPPTTSSNPNPNNPTPTLTTPQATPTPTPTTNNKPSPSKPPPQKTSLPSPTIILLATLIPSLLLLLCLLTAYTLTHHPRKNTPRETDAAHRYLTSLAARNNFNAEEVWDDDSIVTGGRRMERRDGRGKAPTVASDCFSSVGVSTAASVADSTAEEPTNLSSYSSLVYGN
ncbi:hypothetical protein Vi05172_g12179 [Venturia inaequalis]|nr:hypothetical protein Vi05172_g12179 [Venturia inaequalis]